MKISGQAEMLGKRNRREQVLDINSSEGSTSAEESASKFQARFRQHFEASFDPLDGFGQPPSKESAIDSKSDGMESEWEGISDEDQVKAQIIQYQGPDISKPDISSDEFKTFMVRFAPFTFRLFE